MLQKIGFWGSVASIVSIIALFVPTKGNSDSQTSHGNQSPNIQTEGDVKGDIIIQYHNYNKSGDSGKGFYYLERPNGGATLLFDKPSLLNYKIICQAESGSRADLLDQKQEEMNGTWVKVHVLDGTCKGKIGWTGKDNLHKSN